MTKDIGIKKFLQPVDKYYLFNGDIILFDSNCTDEE